MPTTCYLCLDIDPNEVHYDETRHHICLICAVKLWELARQTLQFEMRDDVVVVATQRELQSVSDRRVVTLTTGYELAVDDLNDLQHLLQAAFGESLHRLAGGAETSRHGFAAVADASIREVVYVAGQLRRMGELVDLDELIEAFWLFWDQVSERMDDEDDDDRNSS